MLVWEQQLLVVVLPTKESVFWPRVDQPHAYPELARLVENETGIRERFAQALEKEGIPVIDVLSALRKSPTQPYFEDFDSHPNETGHAIIAHETIGWIEANTDLLSPQQ